MEKTDRPASPQVTALQRPKGTQDILPVDMAAWHQVETLARQYLAQYRYTEIRTPIFESTALFERGVGEATDIVHKEMYTFEKGERSLTLRPENTAGVVRAYIENGLSRLPKPVKLYYIGPMFRYERPQKGRQRQFHQLGVEQLGLDTPASDIEVIQLAMGLLKKLGLPTLALELNNIGCSVCREQFKLRLKQQLQPILPQLCGDCHTRFELNPLRMLDCKEAGCKAQYEAPELQTFLNQAQTCQACQDHFQTVTDGLGVLNIPYTRNRRLVRGLDYYTKTVFEITSTHLGAQNAVCGGGRYNSLVETLGGPSTPAVGWAIGLERLISLLPPQEVTPIDYYIVSTEPVQAMLLAESLRGNGFACDLDLSGKGFGKQLEAASKSGALNALILGEQELADGTVAVKNLKTGVQEVQLRSVLQQLQK